MKSLFIALCLFLPGFQAWAQTAPHQILVSVGDLKESNRLTWKKAICAQVYAIANQVSDTAVNVTCRSFDTEKFLDGSLSDLKKQYDYHLRILRNQKDEWHVDVTNWRRMTKSDFTNLEWKFKDAPSAKTRKEEAFAKSMANLFYYISNEKAFKAGLLVNGVAESTRIEYDQTRGLFLDKATQLPLSIDAAVANFEEESPRKANYLRAGIELGVLFSSGMAIYYKNLVYNSVDFDYGLKEGIHKKLNGEAIRFDDNDKFANYGHVYAGVLYYNVARSNGAGSLESFLVSFASSATWEFLEYHEVFSINDQIMTPIGGYVIGEATYQISCALLQKDSKVAQALGYAVNPVGAINYGLNKITTGDKFSSQPDCKKERWSDISLFLGVEKDQKPFHPNAQNTYIVGLNAEVVTLPDYQKPGIDSGLVLDTSMVKFAVEQSGGDGMGDLRVIAQVVSAAYHNKALESDEEGNLRGYDIIIGLGTATTWNDRGAQKGSANEDFYGTINVLGATAHATLFYHGMKINAEFGFYGDFAMVKSYAIADQKDYNSDPSLAGQPTPLRHKGYYWGLGTSTLTAISVERGRITVGYNAQFSEASNINARDRFQDQISNPAELRDSFVSQKIYVSFRLTKNLSFQLSHELIEREGSMTAHESRRGTEQRTMGVLIYRF